MYRIKSQLCEVFNCTDQELTTKGILDEFRAWLKDNPDIQVNDWDPYAGDIANSIAANKFYDYYTNKAGER